MGSTQFWIRTGNSILKAERFLRRIFPRKASNAYIADRNYSFNNERNIRALTVNDQLDGRSTGVSSLKLGDTVMKNSGCEVIATYNALLLYGKQVSVAGAAKRFEENGCLVRFPFVRYGALGVNPYDIGQIVASYGVNCSTVSVEQMCEPGIYILSYWNDARLLSGIHTIAVHTRNGMCYMYNYTMKGNTGFGVFPSAFVKTFRDSYVTGYKLR